MAGLYPVLQLDVGQFSDRGCRRPNNEDWLGTFRPDDARRLAIKGSLFLVADGMGGHQSGELASRRAVDQVIRNYLNDPADEVATSLRRSIEAANATLYAEATGRGAIGHWGTTLVAAVVWNDELWIANVGDSRAYLLRAGKLRQLSRDHSWAAEVAGAGPAGEGIGHHLVSRALGIKPRVEVDVYPPVKLQTGDRILLCSDGLTTTLSGEEIRDIATCYLPQTAAEALVKAANERGGMDNISAILIQVTGKRMVWDWQTPRHLRKTPSQPRVWQQVAVDLQHILPGGEQGWRLLLFAVTALLIALALISLGLALGLVIFAILK